MLALTFLVVLPLAADPSPPSPPSPPEPVPTSVNHQPATERGGAVACDAFVREMEKGYDTKKLVFPGTPARK